MNKAFKEKLEEKCALKEQIRKLQYFPSLAFQAHLILYCQLSSCLHGPYMPSWSIVWKQATTFTLTLQSS